MHRCLVTSIVMAIAITNVAFLNADDDAIKANLNSAIAEYDAQLAVHSNAVVGYIESRETAARRKGDKKLVDQLAIERTEFNETGKLPSSLPNKIASQLVLARTNLEMAYHVAIREYTKTRQDDKALAVEKQLAEFHSGNGAWSPGAPIQPRGKINGLQIRSLDCSQSHKVFRVRSMFNIQESWALSFEVYVPAIDPDQRAIFIWGDDRGGRDAILIAVMGKTLLARIEDCTTMDGQALKHELPNDFLRRWVKITFCYDASSAKLRLYVDGAMVKEDSCKIVPALDRPMPVLIGGAGDKWGQRFAGQIRHLWLANTP